MVRGKNYYAVSTDIRGEPDGEIEFKTLKPFKPFKTF
jgi:hypothetical protein